MRDAAVMALKFRLRKQPRHAATEALPSLIAALDDTDATVPFVAINVLSTATGKPWTYKGLAPPAEKARVHARWKNWWRAQPGARIAPVAAIAPSRSDPAPTFDLTDVNNKPLSLAGQRGRVTLLNFWGTWCPPCQKEIPDLKRLDATYRKRGVDVVGVALSETGGATSLRAWCRAHGVGYRQALSTEAVLSAFGDIHEVPVSVLIDGAGNIRRRWEGERDYDTFRKAIDAVQSEPSR